jgi:VanZ family protein
MNALARAPLPAKIAILGVCLGVLSWLSLAPTQELPSVSMSDKMEHSIAYAVLTAVTFALFPGRLALGVAGCMAFGVAIEILQATMGFGRQGDWRDAAANASGAALVAGAVLLTRRARGFSPGGGKLQR